MIDIDKLKTVLESNGYSSDNKDFPQWCMCLESLMDKSLIETEEFLLQLQENIKNG